MKIYSSIDDIKKDYEDEIVNIDKSIECEEMNLDSWMTIGVTNSGKRIVAMKITFYDTFSGTPQHDYMIRYMII